MLPIHTGPFFSFPPEQLADASSQATHCQNQKPFFVPDPLDDWTMLQTSSGNFTLHCFSCCNSFNGTHFFKC